MGEKPAYCIKKKIKVTSIFSLNYLPLTTYLKLELGVPRHTCVTCPGSFRKLRKGNNSKNIDARVMDIVHGS